MRKILTLFITLAVFSTFMNCTTDEINEIEQVEENSSIQKNNPNPINIITGNDGQEQECTVIFDFENPNLTDSEKFAIRNFYSSNYFTILGYETIDNDTERWFVLCSEYEAWVISLGLNPANPVCIEGAGCSKVCEIGNTCEDDDDDDEESSDPIQLGDEPVIPGPIVPSSNL